MKKIVLLCSFFGLSVMGVCKYNSSHAALSDLQLENINAISRAIDDGDDKKKFDGSETNEQCIFAIGGIEISGYKPYCYDGAKYTSCPSCIYK